MIDTTRLLLAAGAAALAACAPAAETPAAEAPAPAAASSPAAGSFSPMATEAPAGTYTLEKSHASLLFRVDHLGFSMYTARFLDFDATLELDPANPEAAHLVATVNPASIETDFPYPDMEDFNASLAGPQWLDAAAHPEIRFVSTSIEMTGPQTARVAGEFTLKGITKPLALDVRFNGGYKGFAPYDPAARIGFSATGALNRSDFGIEYGLPPPGTTIGVGDRVEVILEVEFSGPPLEGATPPAEPQP